MKRIKTKIYRLKDIFKWTSGKPIECLGGSIPVYGSNGIIGYTDKAKYNNRIILGRVGAYCGSVEYCRNDFNATDNTLITECDENIITYEYAFYILKIMHLNLYAGGSAQPLITQCILGHIKCELPDICIQNKITNILNNYDKLIENNNHRIKLLETMAEELYKEWFVRFRFPGYKKTKFVNGVPDGWNKSKLKDIAIEAGCNIKKEDKYKYQHYIPIDFIPNREMCIKEVDSIENAESSLQSFKEGDILFGAMRSYFHKVIIAPIDGVTRNTCFVINAKNNIYRSWLYLLLYQDTTIDFSNVVSIGTTMPYVRWKDLNRMNVIVPNDEIIKSFNIIIEPILNRIRGTFFENKLLIQQRDYLLPRLMCGKLSVENKNIV